MAHPIRKFSLLDVMVLIAGLAAGLAVHRSLGRIQRVATEFKADFSPYDGGHEDGYVPYLNLPVTFNLRFKEPKWMVRAWMMWVGFRPGPVVASLSLAALGLSLRGPRPRLRRLARRPGFAAGVAVLLTMGAVALHCPHAYFQGAYLWFPERFDPALWWAEVWFALPRAAGLAVAAAWATLALSGRWAADRGWLDRLGRALGFCWIGMALASPAAQWLPVFPF